jgi:hypothetical protein
MRIGQGGSIGGPGGESPFEHTVQQGETLDSIASQHAVTKQALLESNLHITSETLQPGNVLQIPQAGRSTTTPVASTKDTIEPFGPNNNFLKTSNEYLPDDLIKFAPPYVPVGPVVGGDNVAQAGEVRQGGDMMQVNLSADQFKINEDGNLVISNPDLINFFKTLTGNAVESQEFTLGIVKMDEGPEE